MTNPELVPLPVRIARLQELANDLWWSWNSPRDVFRRLDYPLWRRTSHNPVRMLAEATPEMFERAVSDPIFLACYDDAILRLDAARSKQNSWWRTDVSADPDDVIAYFCAEFA